VKPFGLTAAVFKTAQTEHFRADTSAAFKACPSPCRFVDVLVWGISLVTPQRAINSWAARQHCCVEPS